MVIETAMPSDSTGSVLIGVCTLNEAATIGPLIERLKAAIPPADVLIIDDDSSDGTGSIVRGISHDDRSVTLHVRHRQRGLGTAIVHAIDHAIDQGYEFFLNLDGDFSHDPDQLPQLLDAVRKDPQVDVAIGSRYVPGGKIVGWPIRRRIMSRVINRFATAVMRLPVHDCSGSMRCYRVATLRRIGLENLRSEGYSVLEEILVRLHRHNANLTEVPIVFTDRQQGHSKLTLTEAIRSGMQMIRLSLRR